jgi:hypothetical protein
MISDNFNGWYNGLSAGNQKVITLVGFSETTREAYVVHSTNIWWYSPYNIEIYYYL